MKTIAKLMALSIAATTIVACTNMENPVMPDGSKAVVTVKIADLYKQLGITAEMTEFLANGQNYIYATVLFYDQQGSLKGMFTEQSHTLTPLDINISGIADGTYTLLAIQAAAKGEPVWTLTNENSLEEVEMTIPDGTLLPPYMSLGRVTQTVTVKDGALQAEVSVEALGAIIEAQVKGLTKDDNVNRVMLNNWIVINGIYLDPNRTGGDQIDVADYDGRVLNVLGDKEGAVIEGDVSWKNFSLYCVDYPVSLDIYKGSPGEYSYKWMAGGTTLKPGGKYVIYLDNDPNQLKQLYCGTYEGLDAWLKKRAEHPYAIYPYLKLGSSVDEARKHIAANDESWVRWSQYGLYPSEDGLNFWYDGYFAGSNYVYYYYETEDGKNLKFVHYYYNGGTLSSDVMVPELEEMGFTYKGIIKYPEAPDEQYFIYLSEDGEIEAQRVNWSSDSSWSISFQPTDPDDLELLITE